MREGRLPFRIAHRIVGGAVADLFARGQGAEGLTFDLLDKWSQVVCGTGLPVGRETLDEAARNRTSVTRRNSFGGTAPTEVRRMVKAQERRGRELAADLGRHRQRWAAAGQDLQAACKAL